MILFFGLFLVVRFCLYSAWCYGALYWLDRCASGRSWIRSRTAIALCLGLVRVVLGVAFSLGFVQFHYLVLQKYIPYVYTDRMVSSGIPDDSILLVLRLIAWSIIAAIILWRVRPVNPRTLIVPVVIWIVLGVLLSSAATGVIMLVPGAGKLAAGC